MKKTEAKLYKFFKPYFDKYPELKSLSFHMGNYDGKIITAEEDIWVNETHESDLEDETLSDNLDLIMDAEVALKKIKIKTKAVNSILSALNKENRRINKELRNGPMLKLADEVYYKNYKKINKLAQSAIKDYPWEYISYIFMTVGRDGALAAQVGRRS